MSWASNLLGAPWELRHDKAVPVSNMHGLPRAFVGRDSELDELLACFDDHVRLSTLVGPPGIGKSSLASQHARALDEAGVVRTIFVEIGEVQSASDLAHAMAAALDASVAAAPTTDAAIATGGKALAARESILVVLDNADAGLEALAQALPLWLESAPQALFLCTSREPLRIAEEHVLRVGPLDLVDAEMLFCEHAQSERQVAHDDTSQQVRAIVELVERNPLAIRLAASRSRALSLPELLRRLARPLDILSSRSRDVGSRHSSVRSALTVSWTLLSPAERLTLAECSVFRSSFGLVSAEALLSRGCAPVLDHLESLVDKSLISVEVLDDGSRFSLGPIIRSFADAHLDEIGDRPALERRHAEWMARRAHELASELNGQRAIAALAAIEADAANLTAAIERVSSLDAPLAAKLALPLASAWTIRGPATRVEELLEPLIEMADEQGALLAAAQMLIASGTALRELRRMERSLAAAERAHELADRAGDAETRGWALLVCGDTCRQWGRLGDAGRYYEQALRILEPAATPMFLARARYGSRLVEHLKGSDVDVSDYDAIASLCRAAGDARTEARIENSRAAIFFERGIMDDARRALVRSCELSRQTGGIQSEGVAWLSIGDLEHDVGNFEKAEDAWAKAVTCFQNIGFELGEAFVAAGRAKLAHELGRLERSASLSSQALDIARRCGFRTLVALCNSQLAMLELEHGNSAIARARTLDAVKDIEATGDARYQGFILALHAWTLALCGESEESAQTMARARAAVAHAGIHSGQRSAVHVFDRLCAGASDWGQVDLLGWEPRIAARVGRFQLGLGSATSAPEPSSVVLVASDASWLAIGGKRIDLARRGALRRILFALLEQRAQSPGRGIAVFALLDIGWPGQNIHADAGAQRVYWVIATLRKLGFAESLKTNDEGYLLDPGAVINLA